MVYGLNLKLAGQPSQKAVAVALTHTVYDITQYITLLTGGKFQRTLVGREAEGFSPRFFFIVSASLGLTRRLDEG